MISSIYKFNNIFNDLDKQSMIDALLKPGILEEESVHEGRREAVKNLPETLTVLPELDNKIKSIYGNNIQFENSFSRVYYNQSFLKLHIDRSPLDITLSVCLLKTFLHPWDINISKFPAFTNPDPRKEEYLKINLEENQAALFEGKIYPHWRNKLECAENEKILLTYYHWQKI
jgi:hypothetical protein